MKWSFWHQPTSSFKSRTKTRLMNNQQALTSPLLSLSRKKRKRWKRSGTAVMKHWSQHNPRRFHSDSHLTLKLSISKLQQLTMLLLQKMKRMKAHFWFLIRSQSPKSNWYPWWSNIWTVSAVTWQTSSIGKYRRSSKLSCKTAHLSSCRLPTKFSQRTRRRSWNRCQLRRWRIYSSFWSQSYRSITKESAWLEHRSKLWLSRETRLCSIREAASTAYETGLKVTQQLNASSWLN